MAMKCPKCGAENPDHSFYCGKCAAELQRPPVKHEDVSPNKVLQEVTAQEEPQKTPDPQVAIAVNVRRIFLVLVIGLVLIACSNIVGLWIANADMSYEDEKAMITAWGIISLLIVVFGLVYAIGMKRVTKL
jgi:hypothetical protein